MWNAPTTQHSQRKQLVLSRDGKRSLTFEDSAGTIDGGPGRPMATAWPGAVDRSGESRAADTPERLKDLPGATDVIDAPRSVVRRLP